jgi:putative membrane protein
MILEMFLWTKPKGLKAFGLKSKEFAKETKAIAANQGLYNGFLAAGLIWSLFRENTESATFFLTCIFIAGVYGAYSTKKIKIVYIQTIPASLAILSIFYF